MRNIRTVTALAASALLTVTGVLAAPASAEADCSIVDLSPETIVMGLPATKKVTFDVGTDCEEDEYVGWWLTFRLPEQQGAWGYPLLANHQQDAASRYAYIPGGQYTWQRGGNTEAGPRRVAIDAFVGDVEDGNFMSETLDFSVLRRTTFGSTFNASPEPRRRGQKITIKASVKYANWDTNRYQKFGSYVMLQFRPEGSDTYQNVKWVWDNGNEAKTTVTAERTGSWRYAYKGDATRAPSHSKGDTVVVRR